MIAPPHFPHHQKGQYLVVAVLALSVLSGTFALFQRTQSQYLAVQRARAQGAVLAQMGTGLLGFAAAVENGSRPPGTYSGVNWLKPSTCGGLAGNPVAGYVPCTFNGGQYGSAMTTAITSPSAGAVQSVTSFRVAPTGVTTGTLSPTVEAAGIALNAQAAAASPDGGLYLTAVSNSPLPAGGAAPTQINPADVTSADAGNVALVVSNAPSNAIYLRVDGTNEMLANLNNGGHSLVNAANGTFSGTVQSAADNTGTLTDTGAATVGGALKAGSATVTGTLQSGGPAVLDASNAGQPNATPGLTVSNYVSATDFHLTNGSWLSGAANNYTWHTGQTSYHIAAPDCSAVATGGGAMQPNIIAALQNTGLTPSAPTGSNSIILPDATVLQVTGGGSAGWTVTPLKYVKTMSLSEQPDPSTGLETVQMNVPSEPGLVADPSAQFMTMTNCE
ncbi:MAG TPA: hypothetical protein VFQ88_09620 [Nevskiaceae bacterium]|nr:hypothetical protein [Nevskiaceae bacterium]